MRIVAGSRKGLALKAVPGTKTRPTSDKVKEAIFSRIGPYFTGGAVLDLFAGTGSLGIEALSRGMETGVFIDIDRKAVEVVRTNLQRARLEQAAEVYQNDARRALSILSKRGLSFDLVFFDPPYRMAEMEYFVMQLQRLKLLRPGAHIVIEHRASIDYMERIGEAVQTRCLRYGDTKISCYEYTS